MTLMNKLRKARKNIASLLLAGTMAVTGCNGSFNSDSAVVQNNPPIVEAKKQEPRSSIKLTYSPRVVDGAADSDWDGGSVPGSGTIMDLHRSLGYNNLTSYNFEFSHDITPKDRLTLSYDYSEAESKNWGVRGEIYFDHIIVPANTTVSSTLLMQRLSAQYDRLLLDKAGFKIRGGAGAERLHLRFQLIDPSQSDVEDVNEAWSFYGHLGIEKRIGPKAIATFDISKSLPLTINDITQDNLKLRAGIEYEFHPAVSAILGYSWDRKRVEDNHEDPDGTNCYEVNSDGIELGVRFYFP